MSTSNEPIFDWAQASSLLGDDPNHVDDEMVSIVLELIEDTESEFKILRAKNPVTERKEIGSQAHQLRGSLLNFGFTSVGAALLQLEKGSWEPDEYSSRLDQIWTNFLASKQLLAERYPSLNLS